MRIQNCVSTPGEIVRATFVVADRPTRIEFPIWLAEGCTPGRTMLLTCALHGDEMNAIATLQRFVQRVDLSQLKGRLLILPIVNASGFHANERHVPEDGRDLNRTFPGSPDGSASQQIAHAIFMEIIPLTDVGVDIHDSGKQTVLLPHPRILEGESSDQLELAAAFGTEFIMTSRLPPGYEGVMPVEARLRYGLPFVTVEVGGGTILWEEIVNRGVTGLLNMLIHCGMYPGQMVLPRRQFFLSGRDDLVRPSPIEGLLTRHVELGEVVSAGQSLVSIENPITLERAVMRAPTSGIVHDLNPHARADAGGDVVGVLGFEVDDEGTVLTRSGPVPMRVNQENVRVRLRKGDLMDGIVHLLD